MKAICSATTEYEKHCTTLTSKFKERGYSESLLKKQLTKVNTMNRNNLLRSKGSAKINQTLIAITYCRTLSNMSKIITKNWDILQINSELQKVFKKIPIIAFKRDKNIQEIIRGDDILNEKALKQQFNK